MAPIQVTTQSRFCKLGRSRSPAIAGSAVRFVNRGRRHYRVGVAIGDLALGEDFHDQLPWGLIDNRPYLRCLHGLGVAAWRSEDFNGAIDAFRRLLLLNPVDNQGVRFLWDEVRAGVPWNPALNRRT